MTLLELFDKINKIILDNNNLEQSYEIMENYISDDWKQYVNTSFNGTYYKHLVARNDLSELYVITWLPYCYSNIHDHPDIGCIMKIVQGNLTEEIYHKISDTHAKYITTNFINNIGFKSGNQILHKIINKNDQISVSIHVYSKPNHIQHKFIESQ